MPSVVVIGANRGIGLAFARSYAADGWRVDATCRDPDAATELGGVAGDVRVHRLNATDDARAIEIARSIDGPVDAFIYNAGIYGPRRPSLGEVDVGVWQEVLPVNTIAPLKVAEAFIDRVAAGERKTMAFLTSKQGSIADNRSGGSYFYRTSKAALNAGVRSLAQDLSGKGIKAVVLHPGWVKTDMGGPGASITPAQSVAGLRAVIDNLTPAQSGRFWNYDGTEIAW